MKKNKIKKRRSFTGDKNTATKDKSVNFVFTINRETLIDCARDIERVVGKDIYGGILFVRNAMMAQKNLTGIKIIGADMPRPWTLPYGAVEFLKTRSNENVRFLVKDNGVNIELC